MQENSVVYLACGLYYLKDDGTVIDYKYVNHHHPSPYLYVTKNKEKLEKIIEGRTDFIIMKYRIDPTIDIGGVYIISSIENIILTVTNDRDEAEYLIKTLKVVEPISNHKKDEASVPEDVFVKYEDEDQYYDITTGYEDACMSDEECDMIEENEELRKTCEECEKI